MKEDNINKIVFWVALFIGVVSLTSALSSLMLYAPKNIFVNDDNILVMETKWGKPHCVPMDEIEIKECPDTLLRNMIRTNGASQGKVRYGHFKRTDTGQKLFLFLTGKKDKVCFEYNRIIYVVDDFR